MELIEQRQLGNYQAGIFFKENNQLSLQWFTQEGKTLKSLPQKLKQTLPDEVQQLRDDYKNLRSTLSKKKKLIDRYYLRKKEWLYPTWEKGHLKHKAYQFLSRKLIWQFRKNEQLTNAFRWNGQWVNADQEPIDWIDKKTKVRLWHPIYSSIEEIQKWRDWLTTFEIIQPIKQAFREVYLLTDAERNTHNYSNRMAAHILKQGQFQALARARGWRSTPVVFDNDEGQATIELKAHGLQAAFWVNRAEEEEGYATYIATDQIRFNQAANPQDLSTIPNIVFSEILRDVDLFVGVASVGNDPNWQDTGPDGIRDYWAAYSFGELTATAETRKEVLQKLLPRLKIGKQCAIQGRFLVVEGKIRTYKIHLRSSNILMEPNDQYLCIVPDASQKKKDPIFLPFDGDRTLSVILSKAFLLANDEAIEDPTIISQIHA